MSAFHVALAGVVAGPAVFDCLPVYVRRMLKSTDGLVLNLQPERRQGRDSHLIAHYCFICNTPVNLRHHLDGIFIQHALFAVVRISDIDSLPVVAVHIDPQIGGVAVLYHLYNRSRQ